MGDIFRLISVHFDVLLEVCFSWRTKWSVCGHRLTHTHIMDAMFTLENRRGENVLSKKWKEQEDIIVKRTITVFYLRLLATV